MFSNWIPFRRQIEQLGLVQRNHVVVDLSETRLVDHSVMEKLHETEGLFREEGLRFEVRGLDAHRPLSGHERSARKYGLASVRRLTVVAEASIEDDLIGGFVRCGASGFTVVECRGAGRRAIAEGALVVMPQVKIEVVAVPAVAEAMLAFLRRDVLPRHAVTVCVETVEVPRPDDFVLPDPPEVVSPGAAGLVRNGHAANGRGAVSAGR